MDNFMYIKTMEYSQVNESGTQYDKRRFKIYETVDARYIKNDMYPDNPLICALPPGVPAIHLFGRMVILILLNM